MPQRKGWILMDINDNLERMQRDKEVHEAHGDTIEIDYDYDLFTWVMWMKQ